MEQDHLQLDQFASLTIRNAFQSPPVVEKYISDTS